MDSNKSINIRKALPGDTEAMMRLIHELALYEKAPEEVTVSPEHFKESGFGSNPVWWAWVAAVEDSALMTSEIVGFALYYIRYSTWKGQRMYLEDIIVNEQWRGNGIGGKLMDALIQEATEKKFSGMLWQVLDWNEPAIRFYKKYEARFSSEWLNVSIEL
ncbi:GNAT family N-acetyltransferase [Taibaiella lutea]|uniref:GNAT family N-acetyltransferase n=1 Tax=Taibaiella lutea TaxID=2608001 RepID=A0A5M6CHG3_9BACT|nr:GNAT family N-acetyltransferase [Taibaiella lutea]KAA5532589.1 GNAT family N-acetyltransferase [Taibaiella lutea]